VKIREKLSKEEILQMIREIAERNNGVAVSSKVSSSLRQGTLREFGSWKNACIAAGVQCPSLKRETKMLNVSRQVAGERVAKTDVSAGLRIHSGMTSICFDCAKSAAPLGLRCSWDAELVLPKGAVYDVKVILTEIGERMDLPVVLFCPEFVANGDVNFSRQVRLERKKELAKIMSDGLGGEQGRVKR